jgi:hypothetical protein
MLSIVSKKLILSVKAGSVKACRQIMEIAATIHVGHVGIYSYMNLI